MDGVRFIVDRIKQVTRHRRIRSVNESVCFPTGIVLQIKTYRIKQVFVFFLFYLTSCLICHRDWGQFRFSSPHPTSLDDRAWHPAPMKILTTFNKNCVASKKKKEEAICSIYLWHSMPCPLGSFPVFRFYWPTRGWWESWAHSKNIRVYWYSTSDWISVRTSRWHNDSIRWSWNHATSSTSFFQHRSPLPHCSAGRGSSAAGPWQRPSSVSATRPSPATVICFHARPSSAVCHDRGSNSFSLGLIPLDGDGRWPACCSPCPLITTSYSTIGCWHLHKHFLRHFKRISYCDYCTQAQVFHSFLAPRLELLMKNKRIPAPSERPWPCRFWCWLKIELALLRWWLALICLNISAVSLARQNLKIKRELIIFSQSPQSKNYYVSLNRYQWYSYSFSVITEIGALTFCWNVGRCISGLETGRASDVTGRSIFRISCVIMLIGTATVAAAYTQTERRACR